MMNLLHRPPTRHPSCPVRLAFVSGLSDPSSCQLSPAQSRFLADFERFDVGILLTNFPYLGGTPSARPTALPVASFHNTVQFLRASSQSFRREALPHWLAMVASTERLIVVTLSSGLEILNQCVSLSPPSIPVSVVALGPVARAAPTLPCTLVQGSRDLISRAFFRRCDVLLPGVGHLGYIGQPPVAELVGKILCSSVSRLPAPACISPIAG